MAPCDSRGGVISRTRHHHPHVGTADSRLRPEEAARRTRDQHHSQRHITGWAARPPLSLPVGPRSGAPELGQLSWPTGRDAAVAVTVTGYTVTL